MTTQVPKYVLTDEMSREEWLGFRQLGIGGSDAGAVLGLSDYRTQYDVWEDKIAPVPIEIPDNDRMEWGRRLEDTVAQAWQDKTGMEIRRDNKIRFHPTIPYLLVNLDRVIVAIDDRGPGVLEVKTADEWTMDSWEQGIPLYYYAQVQHELLVTGYKWGELAVLFGKHHFKRYDYVYDELFWETGLDVYVDFWVNHVMTKEPPECRTQSDLNKRYPWGEEGMEKHADAEMLKEIKEAEYMKELAAGMAKDRDKQYVKIKNFMGDAEFLVEVDEDTGQPVILATYKGTKPKPAEACPQCGCEVRPPSKHGSRRFNLKGGIDGN